MIRLGGVLRCVLMGSYLVCVSMAGGAVSGWFLWWERRQAHSKVRPKR